MFNYTLRRIPATTVSVLMLLEVPGAAVIGWWWLGQVPSPPAWPGLALVVAGVATILVAHPRRGKSRGGSGVPRR
jgi:drug/metabolite transporter (DMT)-like permease